MSLLKGYWGTIRAKSWLSLMQRFFWGLLNQADLLKTWDERKRKEKIKEDFRTNSRVEKGPENEKQLIEKD